MLASDAWSDIRREALDDLEFLAGNQWPEEMKQQRDLDGRPCPVINRMPLFVRQVTNDERQNRPSIKIHPVDDKADVETAKIFQGVIRNIEYNSNADVAYDNAGDGAAKKGFGWFRIITDYADPMSFEQEAKIEAIHNDFTVYFDPHSKRPDGSDGKWCLITVDVPKEDYKAENPESELSSLNDWQSLGDSTNGWVSEKSCRVAEYFYIEDEEVEIVQLSNGEVGEKSKLPEVLPEGVTITDERKSSRPVVKWVKIDALTVLDERIFPGKYIPVIPVYGEEITIDNKRILKGVVRDAKDSQRLYNYWAACETETISNAPRAPWIGYEGQFEGHEHEWATANRKNHAFLQVKPLTVDGTPAPLPQRNSFEAPVQAITNARMQAAEDMKATTGIYDAALGARSNETSGVAIRGRQQQAQTSNFHFMDNLTRSIRHAGRILVDIIPEIYDTARAVRIIGEDDEQKIVRINEVFQEGGEDRIYDFSTGKYDVVVETGPSYATKRQEAVASMLDLTKAYPQVAQVAGDIMVKSMDWPYASEVADRLKKTLPPGLIESDEKKPIPPEAQAQLEQQGQMIEMLTGKLNESNELVNTKRMELESKERIEMAKLQVNLEIESAKLGSKEAMFEMQQEIAQIERRLQILNYDQPITEDETGDAGPQEAVMTPQEQQQPTGGYPPGPPMGV